MAPKSINTKVWGFVFRRDLSHVFHPFVLFLDATANDFRGAESVKSGTVDRLFKNGDVRKCTGTRGIQRPMGGISRTKRHKFTHHFFGGPKAQQGTKGVADSGESEVCDIRKYRQ